MADKPEALRLADALACGMTTLTNVDRAAAELRRQHAEIEQLKAERDALLKALKTIKDIKRLAREMQQEWCPAAQDMVRIASAAIAKAGGGND